MDRSVSSSRRSELPQTFDSEFIDSFSKIGGFDKPYRILEHTRFGPWKKCSRLTILEKIFLGAWYIALVVILVLTFVELSSTSRIEDGTTTFGLILIVASFFSFFYVTTGVYQEQPHEIIALCITNAIVLGYVVINFVNSNQRNQGDITQMKLVRLFFSAVFSAVFLPLSLYLAHHYWTCKTLITFAIGSVNPQRQSMAQVNFLILLLRKGIGLGSTQEIFVVVLNVFITIVWTFLGRIAARKEHVPMLIAFVVFSFPNFLDAGRAFYTLRSSKLTNEMLNLTLLSSGSAVIMRCLILILTVFLYRNFGKELKGYIFRGEPPQQDE